LALGSAWDRNAILGTPDDSQLKVALLSMHFHDPSWWPDLERDPPGLWTKMNE